MKSKQNTSRQYRKSIIHFLRYVTDEDLANLFWCVQQFAAKGLDAAARKEEEFHA